MTESAEDRIAGLFAQIEQAKADVEALTDPEAASKAIVPLAAGTAPAEITRAQLAHVRAAAMKKTQHLKGLQQALKSEMEARVREMDVIMAPLIKQVKRLEEATWTVNLYLGRDEEIVPLLDGEPAPADTPITLRQQVLSMDEETAAFAAEGGIDATKIDVFDEWIKDPAHLASVFPEQKGVVVLVPRMRGRDYADPWMDEAMRKENVWSYFLIRNGERLFRMRTDFVVGKHLIPTTDEFTGLFTKREYNHKTREYEIHEIVPGSRDWDQASESQDARQRHYMRMAMVLQGLVDRTTVWHPLPPQGVNLLNNDTYEHGTAVLLRDAEAVLTDGREDFYDWLARLNRELRPGMRILGAFDTEEFRDAGGEYTERHSNGGHYHPNDRITPTARDAYYADRPATGELHRLEGYRTLHSTKGLFFKFKRTTERWTRGSGRWAQSELRAPKTKGTCVILPGDRFILPFDLVTVEEMRYYLGSRTHRKAYEQMFPLLHAAIEAKEAEQAAEAPFRTLLAGEIAKAHNVTLDEAEHALGDLVDWWKLSNKWHRPLVVSDDPATEGKAIQAILGEYAARTQAETAQSGDAAAESAMVARIKALNPDVMVIGRKRDGGYLAFAPQPRRYADDIVRHDVWATEYTSTKTGKTIKTREWVQPGTRMDKARILLSTPAWEAWDIHAAGASDLTDPEIDEIVATLPDEIVAMSATGWPSPYRNRETNAPQDVLVLGVALDQKKKKFEVWTIPAKDPEGLTVAPSATANNTVRAEYAKITVRYTKTPRGGVEVKRTDDSGDLYFHRELKDSGGYNTATAEQPWNYVWDGRRRDAIAVVEFAENQRVATGRAARIKAHNTIVSTRREQARKPIYAIKKAWEERAEAEAYTRFIEDYADPDLWEGHKKTLRGLEADIHPHGRGIPDNLMRALCTFVDEDRSFEGHTVRSLLAASDLPLDGIDEDLIDLPVWDASIKVSDAVESDED